MCYLLLNCANGGCHFQLRDHHSNHVFRLQSTFYMVWSLIRDFSCSSNDNYHNLSFRWKVQCWTKVDPLQGSDQSSHLVCPQTCVIISPFLLY
jgi:hypothetical protein